MSTKKSTPKRDARVANKAARAINRLYRDQSTCSDYLRKLNPDEELSRNDFKHYLKNSSREEYFELLTQLQPDETAKVMHKAFDMEETRVKHGKNFAPIIAEEPAKRMYEMLKVREVLNVSFDDVHRAMKTAAAMDAARPSTPPAAPKISRLTGLEVDPLDEYDPVPARSRPNVTQKPLILRKNDDIASQDGGKKKRKRSSEKVAGSPTGDQAGTSSRAAPNPKKQKIGDILNERRAVHAASQSIAGILSKPSLRAVTEAQKKAEKYKKKRQTRRRNKAQAGDTDQATSVTQPAVVSEAVEPSPSAIEPSTSVVKADSTPPSDLGVKGNAEEDAPLRKRRRNQNRSERRKAKKALHQEESVDAEMADAAVAEAQPEGSVAAVNTHVTDIETVETSQDPDRPKKKVRRSRHKSKLAQVDQADVAVSAGKRHAEMSPPQNRSIEQEASVDEDEEDGRSVASSLSATPDAVAVLPCAVAHTKLPLKPTKQWELGTKKDDQGVEKSDEAASELLPPWKDEVTSRSITEATEEIKSQLHERSNDSQAADDSPDDGEVTSNALKTPSGPRIGHSTSPLRSTAYSDGFLTAAETVSPTASTFKTPFAGLSYDPESPWTPIPSAFGSGQGAARKSTLPLTSSLGQVALPSYSTKPGGLKPVINPSRPQGKVSSIPEYDDTQDIRANFRKFNAVLKGKSVEDDDSDNSSEDESSSSSGSDSDAGASIAKPKDLMKIHPEPATIHSQSNAIDKEQAPEVPAAGSIDQQDAPPDVHNPLSTADVEMVEAPAPAIESEETIEAPGPIPVSEEAPMNTSNPGAIELTNTAEKLILDSTEPHNPDTFLPFGSLRGSVSPNRSQISPTPQLPDLPELLSFGGYVPQPDDSDVGGAHGYDPRVEDEVEIDLLSYLPDDTETPRFVRPSAIEYSSPQPHQSDGGSDIEMEGRDVANFELAGSIHSTTASQHSFVAEQNAPQVPNIHGTAEDQRRKSPPADNSPSEAPLMAPNQERINGVGRHGSEISKGSNNGDEPFRTDENQATVDPRLAKEASVESPSRLVREQSDESRHKRSTTPRVIINPTPEDKNNEASDMDKHSDSGSGQSSPLSELSRSPSPVPDAAPDQSNNLEGPKGTDDDEERKPIKKRKTTGTKSKHFTPSPVKKPRVPAGVSGVPFPKLSAARFGLIQEELASNPFRLLLAVTFLNKTKGRTAVPVYRQLMERYPTPQDLASAKEGDISTMIYSLGFQNQRARKLIRLAQSWLDCPPQKGKRYRTRDYPLHGDGRTLKPEQLVEEDADEVAGALEVGHMYGLGPYAWDSWRIFCRDVLRGVASGYNGEGVPGYEASVPSISLSPCKSAPKLQRQSSSEFEPEWKRVVPLDKELRACLRWMWLREGWEWDPLTGDRHPASVRAMREANAGEAAWQDPQQSSPTVERGSAKREAKALEGPGGSDVREEEDVRAVAEQPLPSVESEPRRSIRRSTRIKREPVSKDDIDSGNLDGDEDVGESGNESGAEGRAAMDIDDSLEDPDFGDDGEESD
ncbi:hypothetical protein MBLNU459_g8196t2 [Dothideomycetes sp. NU459]